MPQLNPSPWFFIFILSWTALLVVVLPKTLNYLFPNEPTLQSAEKTKQDPWTWPWF
nr:ATP synthase F0 subunit 8 [Polydactylus virginicus]